MLDQSAALAGGSGGIWRSVECDACGAQESALVGAASVPSGCGEADSAEGQRARAWKASEPAARRKRGREDQHSDDRDEHSRTGEVEGCVREEGVAGSVAREAEEAAVRGGQPTGGALGLRPLRDAVLLVRWLKRDRQSYSTDRILQQRQQRGAR